MEEFYTYLWLREDGTPYYVGKGKGERAFVKHGHLTNPPPKERILIQEFPDEVDAFIAERFLIFYYGRQDLGTGCLRNMTAGGDGFSGGIFSEDHRQKISAALKGKPKPPRTREHCQRMSEAKKGTFPSEKTRQKMSISNKNNSYGFKPGCKPSEKALHNSAESRRGKPAWNTGKVGVSIETHRKMSEAAKGNTRNLGRACSEETRRKISKSNKNSGYEPSFEARRRMSDVNRGNTHALGYRHSREALLKISEASKVYWATRKSL